MNELAALYSSLWGSPGSGWDEEYPTAEDISEDISNQDLIIAVRGGSIIGAIAVAGDRGDSHDDSNDSVLFDKRIKRPCDLARIAVKPGLQGKDVGSHGTGCSRTANWAILGKGNMNISFLSKRYLVQRIQRRDVAKVFEL